MCGRRPNIGNAFPCGYGRKCCRGRVGLVRCSRGCGRIGSAGPSVYLARQGLATMPGGMLDGPAFLKPLPPNHGSMGCYHLSAEPLVEKARGVLVLDDSTLDKFHAKKIPLV